MSERSRGLIQDKAVKALKPGESIAESLGYGAGALQARGGKRGATFSFRYGPNQARIPIPTYNESGKRTTLAEARKRAKELSARYQGGEHDLKAALEREQREREAEAARLEADRVKGKNTLGRLLDLYVEHLEGQGKVAARNVHNALNRHVRKPFPELCTMPASDVTAEDLLPILERILDSGYKREAAKVRAYLRRAYTIACGARLSAQASSELRAMRLTFNPARDLGTIEGANNTRERILSVEQLRALWTCSGPLIRFYLLTGGQRQSMLRRATVDDITDEGLVLWDLKGRRTQPRRHVVPLLPEAIEALNEMAKLPGSRSGSPRVGPYLYTVTYGNSGVDPNGSRDRRLAAFEAMRTLVEIEEPFDFGDLRRTIESRLAALKISTDTRAHLQSHGLGGLQARHYDRHDYLDEKREALERLRDLMQGQGG